MKTSLVQQGSAGLHQDTPLSPGSTLFTVEEKRIWYIFFILPLIYIFRTVVDFLVCKSPSALTLGMAALK